MPKKIDIGEARAKLMSLVREKVRGEFTIRTSDDKYPGKLVVGLEDLGEGLDLPDRFRGFSVIVLPLKEVGY